MSITFACVSPDYMLLDSYLCCVLLVPVNHTSPAATAVDNVDPGAAVLLRASSLRGTLLQFLIEAAPAAAAAAVVVIY